MKKATLTPHQQEIHDNIVNKIITNLSVPLMNNSNNNNIGNRFLSLTGAAGCGKTFLTAKIIESLQYLKIKNYDGICMTAPTHKAVTVLKEILSLNDVKTNNYKTIHAFLGLKPYNDYTTGEEKFKIIRTKQAPPKASLLIIDESSMISQELFNFIVDAVKVQRVNTVLFIGDPFQLLPVKSSNNAIYSLKKQYSLEEVVRQAKDSGIIKLATKIRQRIEKQDFINLITLLENENQSNDITFFDTREKFLIDYYKNESEDKIMTAYTNNEVDRYNKIIRDHSLKVKNIINPPTYLEGDKIRFKSPLVSDSSILNPNILYQNGEEVIIKHTDYIYHQASGLTYWKCTAIGRKEVDAFKVIDPISLTTFNNLLEQYARLAKSAQFPYNKQYWHDYFKLKNTFADVQYIFASTIHKLQGSTYDTVYIDLSQLVNNHRISDDMKYRLVYVAITRARKNVKILF